MITWDGKLRALQFHGDNLPSPRLPEGGKYCRRNLQSPLVVKSKFWGSVFGSLSALSPPCAQPQTCLEKNVPRKFYESSAAGNSPPADPSPLTHPRQGHSDVRPPLRALGDYPVRTAPTEVPCPWLSGWVLPIRGADRKPEGPRREAGVFPFPPALGRCGLQVAALQHRSPPLTPRCSPPNSSFLPKGWLAAWCHPILCRVLHPAQSPKTSLRKCCR